MVTQPASNPLANNFRQPAIYLTLPSKGKYWPAGSIDLPENGQIPVFPMTIKDELVLKTPDALLNGQGTVDTLKSCCPNIKDAWQIPACDLDAILVAIRLASYGEELELSSACPSCKEENEHIVDLKVLLDSMEVPTFDIIPIDNLKIQFKPQSFKNVNTAQLISFETQQLINTITASDLSESEKTTRFNEMFPRITELNVQSIAESIESITVDETEVTNIEHIKEFLNNCDRKVFDALKKHVEELANINKIKPFDVECSECQAKYQTNLTFEFSNFFG